MSAESNLYTILNNFAALTALVSTRIYPDAMPEETVFPAVVFARISGAPIELISGGSAGEFSTMQIGCWGDKRGDVDAVADQVIAALNAAKESYTSRSAGYDPETGKFATQLECILLV